MDFRNIFRRESACKLAFAMAVLALVAAAAEARKSPLVLPNTPHQKANEEAFGSARSYHKPGDAETALDRYLKISPRWLWICSAGG